MLKYFCSHVVPSCLGFAAAFFVACSSDEPAAPAAPAVTTNLPYAGGEAPPRASAGSTVAEAGVGEKRTTASGLQYEVLRQGNGGRPTKYDRVRVHYHGSLPDGTVFDSSVDRGEPSEFGLNQVIPGWTEGVQLMREGAKYRFRIPHYLAYGEAGSPPKIGPRQTLMFDVELIQILP